MRDWRIKDGILSNLVGYIRHRRVDLQKALLLVAVSIITTLVFFPALTLLGFSYRAGDVAVMDIKSPVEIEEEGISLKKGEIVVREGQVITKEDLSKLELISSVVREKRFFLAYLGIFVFTVVLLSTTYHFASRNIRKFSRKPKDLLLMGVIYTGVLLLIRFSDITADVVEKILPVVPASVYIYMIPVAVGPMLVRLFLNSETSLVFALVMAVMAGFFLGGSLELTAYFLVGGIVAAMGVRHCIQRSTVIKAGIIVGAVNGLILLSIASIKGEGTAVEPLFMVLAGFINGLLTAVLTVGVAPIFEIIFGYTTDIKLLELSRMDHPLLKELAMRAPGTYHHSIVIGSLVEAAAESIHANPLLARVSAYYHDIGKLKMPFYFIENTTGENRHKKLAPSMSALILTNHVKEGVEMAKKYRLGQEIIDIIQQHHGTSLITYFYQKAREMAEPSMHGISEKDFRYPGPKPQTREAGLVMLADAIEAASKTLHEPTPAKIQGLTQKIVNRIFIDGQLDECELTLKDLHFITKSFNRVLTGIYHHRIDYPEPVSMGKEERGEGIGPGPYRERERPGEDKKDRKVHLKRLGVK